MKNRITIAAALLAAVLSASTPVHAVTQQLGASGKIQRMVVNHNAYRDEIFITTTDPAPICLSMTLRTNDPNVSRTSFKTLYAFLLAAKLGGKTLEFYTDMSCNLFRLEMMD
jgi:hypothetical protein